MGWLSKKVKRDVINSWIHNFKGNRYFNAAKTSKVAGLPEDVVEIFNEAERVTKFTRKWRREIRRIAEKIPVGPGGQLTECQEIELIYDCIKEAISWQGLRHPIFNDWLDVIRVCARGKEGHKKFYVINQDFLLKYIKKVNLRRALLWDEIENRIAKVTRPRRKSASYKIHLEYAAVEAIYQVLMHVCYPEERSLRGVLKKLIVRAFKAYRQDLAGKKVGMRVVNLLRVYISTYLALTKKADTVDVVPVNAPGTLSSGEDLPITKKVDVKLDSYANIIS